MHNPSERSSERAESSAMPEYTYTLAVATCSSAGACNKTMTRSVEIRRSYREFLHMIKNHIYGNYRCSGLYYKKGNLFRQTEE